MAKGLKVNEPNERDMTYMSQCNKCLKAFDHPEKLKTVQDAVCDTCKLKWEAPDGALKYHHCTLCSRRTQVPDNALPGRMVTCHHCSSERPLNRKVEPTPPTPPTPAEFYSERTVPASVGPLAIQVGGRHYKDMVIQPAEFCQKNKLPFLESCVIKRMCRHGVKNGLEDLRKAKHEIDLIIQMDYPENTTE